MIVDDGEGAALFAECKWRNEPAGEDVLQKLVYRSELFRRQHKSYVTLLEAWLYARMSGSCGEQGRYQADFVCRDVRAEITKRALM